MKTPRVRFKTIQREGRGGETNIDTEGKRKTKIRKRKRRKMRKERGKSDGSVRKR